MEIHETIWLAVSADPVPYTIKLGHESAGALVYLKIPDGVRVYEREIGDPSDVHVQLSPRMTRIKSGQMRRLDEHGSLTIEIEIRSVKDGKLDVIRDEKIERRFLLRGIDTLIAELHAGVRIIPRTPFGVPVWFKLMNGHPRRRLNFPVIVATLSRNITLSYVHTTDDAKRELKLQTRDGVVGPFHVRLTDSKDTMEFAHLMIHPISRGMCPVHLKIPITPAKTIRVPASPTLVKIFDERPREFSLAGLLPRRPWWWLTLPILATALISAGVFLKSSASERPQESPPHFGIVPRFNEGQMGSDPCSRVDPAVVCDGYAPVTRDGMDMLQFVRCRGLDGVNNCDCKMSRKGELFHYQIFSCRSS